MSVSSLPPAPLPASPDVASDEEDADVLNDLSLPLKRLASSGGIRNYDDEPRKSAEGRHSGADDDAQALLEDEEGATRPQRPRAASFSRFSFDFGRNILAIPLTEDLEPRAHLEQNLGLLSGVALVVGGQIGSGIFSTPGIIVSDVGSVGSALLLWLAAGLLAWTGAATFAELGSAIPLNGGTQAYLNYSYGPLVAFLYSWTAIFGVHPGSSAAIALATSEYVCRILYHTAFTADSEESARNIPLVVIKLIGLVILALAGVFSGIGNRISYRVQTILTALKLISLLAVTIMGIVQAARGLASQSIRTDIFAGSSTAPGLYAIALYSALFSYSGWDYINNIAGEMKNAARDLPRVLHISMGATVFLYLSANISYFVVLEKPLVAHSNTVGLDFGKRIFGAVGGMVFALMVALSSFGALHAAVAALSRLVAVAAHDGYLPAQIGELHRKRRTPINAIAVHIGLAAIYLIIGSYKSLITTFGICTATFLLLAAISLLILRVREPSLERPYRTFIGWPLVFSSVSIFILLMPVVAAPVQFLAAAAVILAGLPAYYLIRKREKLSFEGLYSALPTFGHTRPPRRREASNGSLHISKAPDLPRVSEADEEEEDDDDLDDDDDVVVYIHCVMSSGPSTPTVPAAGFDEATQKELQAFVEQEQAKAHMQAKINQFTDMCWDKCITGSLGGRFSRGDESCLVNCVDRFLDSSMFTVKRLQDQQRASLG